MHPKGLATVATRLTGVATDAKQSARRHARRAVARWRGTVRGLLGVILAREGPRLLSGRVFAAFLLAPIGATAVVISLGLTYGLAADPVAASGWFANALGFAAFVYFAGRLAPREFTHLRQRALLGERFPYDQLDRAIARAVNDRLVVVMACALAIPVLLGYVLALGPTSFIEQGIRHAANDVPDGFQFAEKLEVGFGTLLATLAALGFWRMSVIGRVVRRIGRSPALRIRLAHPDGCGGLAPLGRLCLWNGLILAFPSALLGFWLVAAQFFGYSETNVVVHTVLALFVVGIATFAFAAPLYGIHTRMDAEAAPFEAAVEREGAEIHELTRRLAAELPGLPVRKRVKQTRQLRRRRRLYRRLTDIPTWPIRARDAGKFALSQIPTVFGILSAAFGLIERP